METNFPLAIPRNLQEACDPSRTALLVYDMQVGILSQLKNGAEVTARVTEVLTAARAGRIRTFFSRHLSLPKKVTGLVQMRTAMAWQHVNSPEEVKPWFLRDAPSFQIIPELQPTADESVFDKITMSAFAGTYLDIALRDCGVNVLVIAGVATEIGIEPTVRHAVDLGYIPVVVRDACGAGNAAAAERTFASLEFMGDPILTDAATICPLLRGK